MDMNAWRISPPLTTRAQLKTRRTGGKAIFPGADNEKVESRNTADRLRARIGAAIIERVAGPQGPDRRQQIHQSAGERWFAEDRPVRQVHGDSAMFIGGI